MYFMFFHSCCPGDLVTCTRDREIQSLPVRLPDNSKELAYLQVWSEECAWHLRPWNNQDSSMRGLILLYKFRNLIPSIASTRGCTHAKHVFKRRQTSEFQVSNFEVFLPKCEVLIRIFTKLLEKSNSAQVLSLDSANHLKVGRLSDNFFLSCSLKTSSL